MFNFRRSKSLSQDEAYKNLQADKTIQLVDVRTVEEYRDAHIDGSVNIPLDTIPSQFERKFADKSKTYYVICYSGARAEDATNFITKLGYENAYNIGGVSTWRYGLVR